MLELPPVNLERPEIAVVNDAGAILDFQRCNIRMRQESERGEEPALQRVEEPFRR